MSTRERKRISRRRLALFVVVYPLFILTLCEAASRALWTIRKGAPFFSRRQSVYVFYPELLSVERAKISGDDGCFDILLLGGSALTRDFGSVEQALREVLTFETKKKIRVHNVSRAAHTSRDSYYKYAHCAGAAFNLVIVYHGINETRANNCPPDFFRGDYSHYSWYALLSQTERGGGARIFTLPFTIAYVTTRMMDRLGCSRHLPTNSVKAEWLDYGADIKTAAPFRNNIEGILDIARARGERVLLMTYAGYVPEHYSLKRFKEKKLDYALHITPIEVFGKPENVIKGLAVHNDVLRSLSRERRDVIFVDQDLRMPRGGRYFNDIAHLTAEGCEKFVGNITHAILPLILPSES